METWHFLFLFFIWKNFPLHFLRSRRCAIQRLKLKLQSISVYIGWLSKLDEICFVEKLFPFWFDFKNFIFLVHICVFFCSVWIFEFVLSKWLMFPSFRLPISLVIQRIRIIATTTKKKTRCKTYANLIEFRVYFYSQSIYLWIQK